MTRKKKSLFSSLGARITSTFSVALVLFILGIIALIGVAARSVEHDIKNNMGFDIMLSDAANDNDLDSIRTIIAASPYAREVIPHSAQEAADQWKEDTGEDVIELLGINPFAAEIEVRVNPEWASSDSIKAISDKLQRMELVDDIELQTEMIDNVNSNLASVTLSLSIVAVALLFISFVLINNTVRLTVYARRFLIHTMKLVGATPAFIRRPFIIRNIVQGIIAALVAILLLLALWNYLSSFDPAIGTLVRSWQMLCIAIGMILAGVIICAVAATWAANRYISLSYDEMFSQ